VNTSRPPIDLVVGYLIETKVKYLCGVGSSLKILSKTLSFEGSIAKGTQHSAIARATADKQAISIEKTAFN